MKSESVGFPLGLKFGLDLPDWKLAVLPGRRTVNPDGRRGTEEPEGYGTWMKKFFTTSFFVLLLDIPLFLFVAGKIGAFGVTTWLVTTGILGVWSLAVGARSRLAGPKGTEISPATRLLEWGLDVFSGFSLILPGPISDTLGIVVLLPPVRRWLVPPLKEKFREGATQSFPGFQFHAASWPGAQRPDPGGADGEGVRSEVQGEVPVTPPGERRKSRREGGSGARDVSFEILPEETSGDSQ